MRLLKLAVPIAAIAAAIFILYTKLISPEPTDSSTVANTDSASSSANSTSLAESSLDTQPIALSDQSDAGSTNEQNSSATALTDQAQTAYPDLFGYEVGVEDISEEAYIELVERLRNDPVLLTDLLNELRAETDPERLKRLAIMLGATGSAEVLPVAEELVYSSSEVGRKTGLDLLSRVAPQNPAAYDSTMDVLARPQNAGSEVRTTAISQIMPLANHESAAVRRHSVSMLVRLTNDETLSPVLYSALSDSDASVRKAATYAYAQYPYQTSEAVERLVEIIEDPSEDKGVRKGAITAVSNMSPDDSTKERIKAAKIQMRQARQ